MAAQGCRSGLFKTAAVSGQVVGQGVHTRACMQACNDATHVPCMSVCANLRDTVLKPVWYVTMKQANRAKNARMRRTHPCDSSLQTRRAHSPPHPPPGRTAAGPCGGGRGGRDGHCCCWQPPHHAAHQAVSWHDVRWAMYLCVRMLQRPDQGLPVEGTLLCCCWQHPADCCPCPCPCPCGDGPADRPCPCRHPAKPAASQ